MKKPLTEIELEQLGTYNAERLRGIMHEPMWIDYMADLQERYNEQHNAKGVVIRSDGSII